MRSGARVMIVIASMLALLQSTESAEATVEHEARNRLSPQSSLTPDGARTVWSGVFTAAQADRGGSVYAQSCANCHGTGLEGADMSPALAGASFMASWNDLSLGDLAERIRISMPADRPGTLSRQEQADVIAFILRSNRFPAGTAELPTETAALRTIKFVTVQP